MTDVVELIQQQIATHPVLLYMKGTPDFPQCGFSGRVVAALEACQAQYVFVNILAHPEIRSMLPVVADWPTFPQLYVQGDLVGGCDIVMEMFENDELKPLLHEAGQVADHVVYVEAP